MAKSEKAKRRSGAGAKSTAKSVARKASKGDKQSKSGASLPGSFWLTRQVFGVLKTFWKPLGAIVLVYLILNIILASGILGGISSGVSDARHNLTSSTVQGSKFSKALSGFGSVLGSANSSSQGSSIMSSLLLVIESLVIIWALRQLLAGHSIGVKQAYYQSMAPLIPFLLVIFVIILQLLPLTIGSTILAIVFDSTIGNGVVASVLLGIIFIALAVWSLYMISSSILGLYIVTLPDMQPRQALRAAKKLVQAQRWSIARKVLFLPLFVLVAMGVIVVPLIVWLPALVTPVFFIFTMLAILFAHTYLYSLYRSLLA